MLDYLGAMEQTAVMVCQEYLDFQGQEDQKDPSVWKEYLVIQEMVAATRLESKETEERMESQDLQ